MKNIAIMGSTGSIGTQTLEVIDQHPDLFKVDVLTAGSNWKLLAEQALRYHPGKVVIADDNCFKPLSDALCNTGIEVESGRDAIEYSGCGDSVDVVVGAMVGYAGLIPTLNAIQHKKCIALANKETLVVAGEIVMAEAKRQGVEIRPVDSEHSAIFQCIQGESGNKIQRIFLTASGGPFRKYSVDDMKKVTVAQALAHPNWSMGSKVTIDSASMMNKGFEMIEAKWLFNCPPSQIEVVVHPQSIVHSMVEFEDGAVKAQLGLPDMRLPIQYALGYPHRYNLESPRIQVSDFANLTFESPDFCKFPLLRLAYEVIEKGGNSPCILNAANEIAVKAFLSGQLPFYRMSDVAIYTLEHVEYIENPTLEYLISTHAEATHRASEYIAELK
ncbi:MAG: 1-deoxy-D-xylulose-5-phosphate reductoisomerase [Muribaculaceae bacterium]|nr:1-deoxy-D-xylulose-5-phosphate reductoisomerase [Muribaculaceae bacterium]